MFGRQLPQWFGRQGMAPPIDPSIMGMLPQVPGQATPPQIPQQQAPTFTPVAAPQAPAASVGPDREAAMRQQMLAETMQKQYGDRSNVTSPLTAGLYALNQGLGSFLDKRATESKEKVAASDRKALIAALNDADPMTALSKLDNPAAQDAFVQMKMGQMNKKPSETWQDVDTDGDNIPDAQRNSVTQEYKPIEKQLTFDQRRQLAQDSAARNSTTVNTGGGSDKQIFDTLGDSYKSAATAANGIRGLKEAEKALSGPGIYGQFADERLMVAKLGTLFGMDPTAVTNTETFAAAIAPQVAAIVKATGGTQISNADREFAEKAAAGRITLNVTSLKRLIKIGRASSEASVQSHNSKLDKIYPKGKGFDRERALFEIPMDQPQAVPDWAR